MDKNAYLDKVVKQNYSLFLSVAKNILKNHNDAEEIVQKSLLYVIEKYNADSKSIDNLPAYIIVTINSRALNYIRDRKKRMNCELQDVEYVAKESIPEKEMYGDLMYLSFEITNSYNESKEIVLKALKEISKERADYLFDDALSLLQKLIITRSREWIKR